MAANRTLAKLRGISEETCLKIDELHELSDRFMEDAVKGLYTSYFVFSTFEELEYALQDLWEFPPDSSFHTLYKEFKFKLEWVGRGFICLDTGESFSVPSNVGPGDFFKVGNGYLDVGDLELNYCRTGGNVGEVFEQIGE